MVSSLLATVPTIVVDVLLVVGRMMMMMISTRRMMKFETVETSRDAAEGGAWFDTIFGDG
jgi:uncharacterized integral membrane protein